MINLYLSPTESLDGNKTVVKINGEQVQVDADLYNFTRLPNGLLRTHDDASVKAKRINGVLSVEVKNAINSAEATQEELYPVWQIVEGNDVLDSGSTVVAIDWYSDDEREMDELFNSLQPTPQELADADLEIMVLTLLMEMEVI